MCEKVQPQLDDVHAEGYKSGIDGGGLAAALHDAKPSKPTGLIWSEDGKHSSGCALMNVVQEADVAGGLPPHWSTAPTESDVTMADSSDAAAGMAQQWEELPTPGLNHATLNSGDRVSGSVKKRLRKENKER